MTISLLLGIWSVRFCFGSHRALMEKRLRIERMESMFGFGIAMDWLV